MEKAMSKYSDLFKRSEVLQMETLEELQDKLEDSSYDYRTVLPNTIRLKDNGLISSNIGDFPIEFQGADSLISKVFKMPTEWSKRIPFDLLQSNIERLSNEVSDGVIFALHQGTIINAIKGNYKPIPTNELISCFHNETIKNIEWSHAEVELQTINENKGLRIEPKKGDITHSGINFRSSETGFSDPIANTFLYTLVCGNGMILGRKYGQAKIRIKNRESLNIPSLRDSFQSRINNMLKDSSELSRKFSKMTEVNLTFNRTNSLIKSISKITNSGMAMNVFGIDDEGKTTIKSKAKLKEHKDQETSFNFYDIHYKITEIANGYMSETRRKLQSLGGRMFNYEELN